MPKTRWGSNTPLPQRPLGHLYLLPVTNMNYEVTSNSAKERWSWVFDPVNNITVMWSHLLVKKERKDRKEIWWTKSNRAEILFFSYQQKNPSVFFWAEPFELKLKPLQNKLRWGLKNIFPQFLNLSWSKNIYGLDHFEINAIVDLI